MIAKANKVTITFNRDNYEYSFLTDQSREQSRYFTDDKQDAIDTARYSLGESVVIRFRSIETVD